MILCFEQRFWDGNVHLFGHIASSTASRGELFMFWHLSLTPVLIALLAGEDAIKFESLHDDVIVAKAMSVLRSIFGDQTVPEVTWVCCVCACVSFLYYYISWKCVGGVVWSCICGASLLLFLVFLSILHL